MSNPFSALRDSSSGEESGSEIDGDGERSAQHCHLSPIGHEGGMRVALEQSTSDELPFTSHDIEVTLKVLSTIGDNLFLLRLPQLRPIRSALHPLIVEQQKKYGSDTQPGREKGRKKRKFQDREKAERLSLLEKNHINHTQMKAIRMKNLEKLNETVGIAPRVPDGVADEESSFLLLENGDESVCHDGALTLRNSSSASTSIDLRNPISCYICHKPYTQLHFFYHQLCPDCAAFNYLKRTESADLSGRVCLVTGGRTKIGFRCALKLLRCGASVIVTTRFPVDAASRYTAEKDCPQWMDRLQVYGLDFRDLSRLEAFCCHLEQNYDRLDVIINNAAQTVRRPPAYYAHLLEAERIDFTAPEETTQSDEGPSSISRMKQALRGQHQFSDNFSRTIEGGFRKALTTSSEHGTDGSRADEVTGRILTREAPEIMSSAQMTQLPLIPGEEIQAGEAFPAALTDINGQQIDLRRQNSWTMRLNEVPTVELAEVFAINTIAPTIINSRLKAMLLRRPCTAPDGSDSHSSNKKKGNAGKYSHPDSWKFIVNVSAMEGKFYRYKSDAHPHTNMAKAALNMMTRTSAQDYVKSGIYMTAVDTGWINDEKPIELAMAHEKTHNFQTPLDEVDAAARVLDPVIAPLRAAQDLRDSSSHGIGGTDSSSGSSSGTIIVEPPWGYFLKDYVKTEW